MSVIETVVNVPALQLQPQHRILCWRMLEKKISNLFFFPDTSPYICQVMKTVQLTIQEIRMATRPNVYKSKKTYTRKTKHKKKFE
jgi:hypothetical protein